MRLAAALLLTLPGHPFIYYGEELGMQGTKPDEDIREPMRWYRNGGPGVASWKTWRTSDGPNVSVEAEEADPNSLLHLYRRLIGWRTQISALRDGVLHNVPVDDPHVLAYTLQDAQSRVVVVHNLSRDTRTVALGAVLPSATILVQSATGATVARGQLSLPPYGSAILH
jgi:alpha-amylase